MAEFMVSAATGALQPVLGKLVALLGEEYKRLRSIRTEIKSLTRELEAIDVFLENMAEAEDPNPQDKAWMKEVRELSYDVEDNLDEFMARVVVADKAAKPDGFLDKIKGSLKRVKARHDIAKAIEDLKKQAIEVSRRNARYRSGEAGASSKAQKIDRRALAIFEDALMDPRQRSSNSWRIASQPSSKQSWWLFLVSENWGRQLLPTRPEGVIFMTNWMPHILLAWKTYRQLSERLGNSSKTKGT